MELNVEKLETLFIAMRKHGVSGIELTDATGASTKIAMADSEATDAKGLVVDSTDTDDELELKRRVGFSPYESSTVNLKEFA